MYKKLFPVILLLIIFTLFLQLVSANVGTMAFAQEDNAPVLKDTSIRTRTCIIFSEGSYKHGLHRPK